MIIFIFHIVLLCISAELGYRSSVTVEASPNITVLRKYNHAWCVARGEESYSAMTWTSKDNTMVCTEDFSIQKTSYDCNIITGSCEHWTGWYSQSTTSMSMPALMDYRWNELPVTITDGKNHFPENGIPITYNNNKWETVISVLAEKDAYIVLCEKKSPWKSGCYWIILGGWIGDARFPDKCAIRRCPQGLQNCRDLVSGHKDILVSSDQWIHLKIVHVKTEGKLLVTHGDQEVLYYEDKYPINIQFMKFRSKDKSAYFRIHHYKFLWSRSGEELQSRLLQPQSTTQCWSILYQFNAALPDTLLEIKMDNLENSEVIRELRETKREWRHEQILIPPDKHMNTSIRLTITGKRGNFFAVGGIRMCNPLGDIRISKVQTYYKEDVGCYSLKHPEEKLKLGHTISEDYEDNSTLNCKNFGIPGLNNCTGVTICMRVKSNASSCFCSGGYTGSVCLDTYPVLVHAPASHSATTTSLAIFLEDQFVRGRGEAIKYILQYRPSDIADQTNKWIQEGTYSFPSNELHNITNLKPLTEYEFRAVLVDRNGRSYADEDIPYSKFTTSCNHPDKSHIKVEASPSMITFFWEGVVYPCRVQSYSYIIAEEGMSTSENLYPIINLPVTKVELQPFTNYSLDLCYKKEKIFSIVIQTKEDAPDPPTNVTAAQLSLQNVRVTWKNPKILRGKLRLFFVKISINSSGLRNKISYSTTRNMTVDQEESSYTMDVNDLYPASEYTVEVYGVTVSPGDSASTTVKTFVPEPYIGSYLEVRPDSIMNTTFQIIIPNLDHFIIERSAYIIIVTSEAEIYMNETTVKIKDEKVKDYIENEFGIDIENDMKSWVAAEVQPGLNEFTIGDPKTDSETGTLEYFTYYPHNYPLTSGQFYHVSLIAVNKWQDEYKFNSIKLKERIQTVEMHKSAGGSNNITGWIMLGIILLCIPVAAYFIIKRRNLKKEGDQLELKGGDILSGNHDEARGRTVPPDLESEEMSTEPKLPPSQRLSRRVAINELEQYVKIGISSGEFQRQHALFPRGQTREWTYGKLPQNRNKNRYGNLVAYDETRVKLKKLPEDPFSDYINANYINGYNTPKFYIATQGPKQNTVVDFWRMIWQEHVQVIAMLANVIENGKAKCEQYWPELGQEISYGVVNILNISNQIFADYTFRVFNITCKGKTRKVHHLHFTSWPDHGVPLYPQSVASYIKKLLATPPGSGPIVVHCSAGVGRTGTIMLADTCLRMAAAECCVDVLHFLQQMREQRANLVDNLDQYKLVHIVLLECLVIEPSSYPCDSEFEKRVQKLFASGEMQHQFKQLYELKWQDQAIRYTSTQKSESSPESDSLKNRDLNIVPGSNGRVYLSQFPVGERNSNYINAVYVDGFRTKDQFIVTQWPLDSTICDFWRLIDEKNISLIVLLNGISENNMEAKTFWPTELKSSMKPVPHIKVTKKQEDISRDWSTHRMYLTKNGNEGQEENKGVDILHLKGWRHNKKQPPSASLILELWQETERMYSGKDPIVVCCFDGATACGYFVALAFLIEKIKLEQQCDVCQAVRTVRQNREQFIPTFEQFEYLYKGAVTFIDSFQTYANFN